MQDNERQQILKSHHIFDIFFPLKKNEKNWTIIKIVAASNFFWLINWLIVAVLKSKTLKFPRCILLYVMVIIARWQHGSVLIDTIV